MDIDLEIRIVLVVLESDVVAGSVLFDEIAFEDERLGLRVGDNVFNLGHLGNQLPGFGGKPCGRPQIGTHPVSEMGRLAHVDDVPVRIPHQVDAGVAGKSLDLLVYSEIYIAHININSLVSFYCSIGAHSFKSKPHHRRAMRLAKR